MVDYKKILLFLIVIIVVAAAGFWFYWQKTHISLDISPAAVQAKCLADVSQMTDEQIIYNKISTLPFATAEELGRINQLMYQYLRCQFYENPSMAQLDKTTSLIQTLKISDQQKSLFLAPIQDRRDKIEQRISGPSFKIILYPSEKICPYGKEDPDLVAALLNTAVEELGYPRQMVEPVLSNYCTQIIKYTTDQTSLAQEIYNFKNWSSNAQERKFEYRWKALLAVRFGGKDKAMAVCNNLTQAVEKQDCQQRIESLAGWPVSAIYDTEQQGCTGNELNQVKDLICQPRG
jgi:hypothetical protein